MKSFDVNYVIPGYEIAEVVARGLIEATDALFARVRKEREEIDNRLDRKRKVQADIDRDIFRNLSIEEKLRAGIYRF